MPDPALLNDLGRQWRDALPPQMRDSPDHLAVIHSLSQEVARFEGCLEAMRLELNPATSTLLLNVWETMVRLPAGGAGASLTVRRQRVLARLRKVLGQAEGREWEQQITAIIGAGWTYDEHDPADSGSPPAGTLRIHLPFPTGTSRFVEAQQQIRDVTPATFELEFSTPGGFQLDVSEMDITDFGH